MKPLVSVVIVSDYAGGKPLAWQQLRLCLEALAAQDVDQPTEFLFVESEQYRNQVPDDIRNALPSLKTVFSPAATSYELKNEGVRAAAGEFVALLDADCIVERSWLREIVAATRRYADAAAINGRLTYPGRNLSQRLLALIDRSYVDRGVAGRTRHVTNTNVVFRRSFFLDHCLPKNAGPFAAMLQSESILRAGGTAISEPRIRAIHLFEGWSMERDIRRNIGYACITVRRIDPKAPHAWVVAFGRASIPLIVGGRTLTTWLRCIRVHDHHGVRWYLLPLAFLLAPVLHAMEVPGMLSAFRGEAIAETSYR